MRSGTERLPGIDHDGEQAGARRFPGRPDPQRPDLHGPVEALPLVLPAFGDRLHANVAEPRRSRAAPSSSVKAASSIESSSRASAYPSGKSSSIAAAASSPRPTGTRTEARSRLSGTRSSASRRTPRPRGRSPRWRSLRTAREARCCSSLSWRGTATFTSTRWSPRPKPWSTGIPLPFRTLHRPGLRAGLEIELELALERRHLGLRAERRFGHREVDRRVDVVALAHESLVGSDVDEDIDVPGLPAERARVSFARETDPLAVVDSRRDLDVDVALLEDSSRACACLARVLDDLARAAAARTRLASDELAEPGARHSLEVTRAAALFARRDCGARLDSVAAARIASSRDLNRHRASDAGSGLLELDLDLRRNVRPARSPRAGGDAEDVVAEEGGEDVGEAPEIERRRTEARRSGGRRGRNGRRAGVSPTSRAPRTPRRPP